MKELILSDITEMGQGYCVIGLEQVPPNGYRSIRPVPPRGNAWPDPFRFGRGDYVRFKATPIPVLPPHIEDQGTHGLIPTGRCLSEDELVDWLEKAEVSATPEGLFECELQGDTPGGNAWVAPQIATRSICGIQYTNIRFRVFVDPGDVKLRAKLLLPSGDTLNSLPIVDREWRKFLGETGSRHPESRTAAQLEAFFNGSIRNELLRGPGQFARIGLARAKRDEDKCWLMLDSLFPQPNASWLEDT